MNAWKWTAIALGAWCALSIPAALATGWFFSRIKHPPRANPPAAGTSPVPGRAPGPREGGAATPQAASAPAPATLLGDPLMRITFYPGGISVTEDYGRQVWWMDVPPAGDREIRKWLASKDTP